MPYNIQLSYKGIPPTNLSIRIRSVIKTQFSHYAVIKMRWGGGTWVAQWVKASAFSSGYDPRVLGWSPTSGSLLSGEPHICLSAYL